MKTTGATKGRYWRTVPINSSLRNLILEIKGNRDYGVPAPVVMKIGGWKNTSTMDIYLRPAGVDTKEATECLGFTPESINFGDNVVSIFNKGRM